MHRRLRVDVVDRDAVFVLMRELRRNLAIDDLLKNGFGHEIRPRITRISRIESDQAFSIGVISEIRG
jgi:hypothetical protein